MELTEQERELEKSTAKAHGSLSLGLFATAVFTASRVAGLWWVPLAIIGVLLALSGICLYLSFHYKWRRIKILEIARQVQIRYVAWFLGFVVLGISLLQVQWGFWWGILCICIAYLILGFGIGEDVWTVIKEFIRKNLSKAKK